MGDLTSSKNRPRETGHYMAGDEGFEPPNAGTRTQCLTTWRIPNKPPVLYHQITWYLKL